MAFVPLLLDVPTHRVGQVSREKALEKSILSCALHSCRALLSGKFARNLMNIAPRPPLARHDRAHHRMSRLLKVPGRVAPWRGIATADVATGLTLAQRHPLRPFLQTFFAGIRCPWWREIACRQLSQVLAWFG